MVSWRYFSCLRRFNWIVDVSGRFYSTPYIRLSKAYWYVAIQYTFTGYDASAHVTEETRNAAIGGPVGMVMSVVVSAIAGFVYIISMLFAIQNFDSKWPVQCLKKLDMKTPFALHV